VHAANLRSSSTAGLTACAWCRFSACELEAQPSCGAKPTAQVQHIWCVWHRLGFIAQGSYRTA